MIRKHENAPVLTQQRLPVTPTLSPATSPNDSNVGISAASDGYH